MQRDDAVEESQDSVECQVRRKVVRRMMHLLDCFDKGTPYRKCEPWTLNDKYVADGRMKELVRVAHLAYSLSNVAAQETGMMVTYRLLVDWVSEKAAPRVKEAKEVPPKVMVYEIEGGWHNAHVGLSSGYVVQGDDGQWRAFHSYLHQNEIWLPPKATLSNAMYAVEFSKRMCDPVGAQVISPWATQRIDRVNAKEFWKCFQSSRAQALITKDGIVDITEWTGRERR